MTLHFQPGDRQPDGLLTIVRRLPQEKKGTILWLCRCDCGGERAITGTQFKFKVKSCGCARRAMRTTPQKRGNDKRREIWHARFHARIEEIVRLRKGGASLNELARRYGCSKQRISQICKERMRHEQSS